MSYESRTIAEADTSGYERAAAALVGLGILSMVIGWTTLLQWTGTDGTILGVSLFDLFGGTFALSGLGVLALGLASRFGTLDTTPDDSAGVVTGGFFGVVGAVAGGTFAAQTLGFGVVGWLPVALAAGFATAAMTVVPREDVGSTLPAGGLALLVGLLVLGGVLTPEWEWAPDGFSAELAGTVAVPLLAIFVGLIVAWAAAKAHEGFGTRGRQTGAHMLIGMNAFGMLAILLLVIMFVVVRGAGKMTQGIQVGLFTGPVFWFRMPGLGEYVILEAPGLWFHWPFAMNGFTLSNQMNGVFPSIVGTFWVVLGAVLFAVPLGVGAAVFLTEYAEQGGFTSAVEVATNGLWSTPSIVYGLFGYAFLVPRLGNNTSLLAGQLVLGFMLLPLVLITSREAIKTVPDEYRDASAALGVTRWETIKSVVLPAAMPGVITGVILGVGRIAGETAPLILVMAGGLRAPAPNVLGAFRFTASPPFVENPALLQSASALPYKLYASITSGVVGNDPGFGWATALILLLLVLSFYAVGIVSRIYFRRKLEQ
ncbi:phosphate ABC transporter permease PstA [Halomicrococcus sp. SG-WS-1]|uniref:phosphate ABC transporter permease PstA n=1 Tax=Halomicrococcus sp. SG-WS-1 TaxID=3439057 RepID=UPI003F790F55